VYPYQKKIKYRGKTYLSVAEACRKLKFSYALALIRLARKESIKDVFFRGKLIPRGNQIVIDKKKYRSIEDARLQLNPKVRLRSVHWRYRSGWPIKAALGLIKHDRKDREKIKFKGKNYESLSALARAHKINPDLFIRRIRSSKYKHKFTISQALGLKKFKGKGFVKPLIVNGKKFSTMSAAAKSYGYSPTTVNAKLLKGWSPEQALGLKKRRGFYPGLIGIVYILKNKINKKIYIGATLGSLSNRWQWHVHKSNYKYLKKDSIAEAISKYGKNNFTKRILKRLKNIQELSQLERYYINKYDSQTPNGYNLSTGGFGFGNLGKKIKIKGLKFKTMKDAAKHFGINIGTFSTRIRSGWTLVQAAGLKKNNQIPINNIQVKIDGKKFNSRREAAKFYGIHEHTVSNRLFNGWSIKDALKTKIVDRSIKIKFDGKNFKSIRNLAKFYNVSPGTLSGKLKRGVSIKEALQII
jgi:hypothetical protein